MRSVTTDVTDGATRNLNWFENASGEIYKAIKLIAIEIESRNWLHAVNCIFSS